MRGSRKVIEQAIAANDYDTALQLADATCRLCQKLQGKEFRKEAQDRRTEVEAIARQVQIQQARQTVKLDPSNGEANLLLGHWYCLSEQDWRQGLSCLAKGSDAELKALAVEELNSPPAEPQQQVKLGDAWWDSAHRARAKTIACVCCPRATGISSRWRRYPSACCECAWRSGWGRSPSAGAIILSSRNRWYHRTWRGN